MVKKEARLPTLMILDLLTANIFLLISLALPFVTVYSSGALLGNGIRIDSSVSGFAVAAGNPTTGTSGFIVAYLIPIGGFIGILSLALGLVSPLKWRPRDVEDMVLVSGLLAIAGSTATCLKLNPIFGGVYHADICDGDNWSRARTCWRTRLRNNGGRYTCFPNEKATKLNTALTKWSGGRTGFQV